MPWTSADAKRHTKKAKSKKKQGLWSDVANQILRKTGDEGRAVREANAVVAGTARHRKKGKKHWHDKMK